MLSSVTVTQRVPANRKSLLCLWIESFLAKTNVLQPKQSPCTNHPSNTVSVVSCELSTTYYTVSFLLLATIWYFQGAAWTQANVML